MSNPGFLNIQTWGPSIRIHKVHRIVIAEGIRRDAVVLLRQRVRCGPAGEVRIVEPGAVVDQADVSDDLLLLGVVSVAVGRVVGEGVNIHSGSEREVVVLLDCNQDRVADFGGVSDHVKYNPDVSKMVLHMPCVNELSGGRRGRI